MKWDLFSSKRAFSLVLTCMLMASGVAFAEKSMWQKFKDFFNPGETFDCSGPICDEVHLLDDKISKVEGKYSRERRPSNKERFKKELDSLNTVRDSLIVIIKNQQAKDSLNAASSASVVKSSASIAVSSAAIAKSSAVPATSALLESSSGVTEALPVCKTDTVFIRDTVVVHDTLYVVVTNKPAETVSVPSSSSVVDSGAGATGAP